MAERAIEDRRQLADAHASLGERLANHPPERRAGQLGREIEHRARR
jgi:hypothetical protein